jgi:hypothetical protein
VVPLVGFDGVDGLAGLAVYGIEISEGMVILFTCVCRTFGFNIVVILDTST